MQVNPQAPYSSDVPGPWTDPSLSPPLPKLRSSTNSLFVRPPGTCKISLSQSIVRTFGRLFERISSGGVRDEAEMHGRSTYGVSGPRLVVQALGEASCKFNKIGQSNFHWDFSAAVLEVLDLCREAFGMGMVEGWKEIGGRKWGSLGGMVFIIMVMMMSGMVVRANVNVNRQKTRWKSVSCPRLKYIEVLKWIGKPENRTNSRSSLFYISCRLSTQNMFYFSESSCPDYCLYQSNSNESPWWEGRRVDMTSMLSYKSSYVVCNSPGITWRWRKR